MSKTMQHRDTVTTQQLQEVIYSPSDSDIFLMTLSHL